jgi:putative Ca2+/H+ antiporter (TMEM165/GDT1 family)
MAAFLISMALIFAAEFGDKTQLVAMAFAARYRPMLVLTGITIASFASHLLSVILGQTAGAVLPQGIINVAAGLAFIGFGVWMIRSKESESEDEELKEHKFGPVVSVALTFFLAEVGDKTMLTTMTIASQQKDFVGVWLGSSIGMVLAAGIAILLGNIFGKRIPTGLVKGVAAAIFLITGIVTLAHAAFAQ